MATAVLKPSVTPVTIVATVALLTIYSPTPVKLTPQKFVSIISYYAITSSTKNVPYEVIPQQTEAIQQAIESTAEESFIRAISYIVTHAIEIGQEYLDKENEAKTN